MNTRQIANRFQDDVVSVYRDRMGYPRIAQPSETPTRLQSLAVVVVCLLLIAAILVLA
jgi:hypothetical protein